MCLHPNALYTARVFFFVQRVQHSAGPVDKDRRHNIRSEPSLGSKCRSPGNPNPFLKLAAVPILHITSLPTLDVQDLRLKMIEQIINDSGLGLMLG